MLRVQKESKSMESKCKFVLILVRSNVVKHPGTFYQGESQDLKL